MFDNFDLYEFVKSLSIAGWVVIIAAMIAVIYVLSKGTEALVTKKCPFCEKRIPKRANECTFCKKAVG
ncbi:MAG: hypothetical protein ACJ72Z_05435 [Pyrinomonadaceae bacterium]